MIGSFARKRMQMGALLALIAILAAMFAAFPSAQAADAIGDITANSGWCVDPTPTGDPTGDAILRATAAVTGAEINVQGPTAADANVLEPKTIECAETDHGKPVKVAPNGTVTPLVEILSPTVSITLNDSDGIVQAGATGVTFVVDIANFASSEVKAIADANTNDVALEWVRISGVLAASNQNEDAISVDFGASDADIQPDGKFKFAAENLIIPDGTAAGDYVISARVTYDGIDTDLLRDDVKTATASLTVGEPGTNLAAATLSLGNETEDDPLTTADETKAETGVTSASGDVWLKVEATNSLGSPSDSPRINTITAIGPNAELAIHGSTAGVPNVAATTNGAGNNSASEATAAEVTSTMFIKVGKLDNKPGSVDVYVLLIGDDGAPRTDTVTVTFTGAGAALELGAASSASPGGQTEFTVSATDASGNVASVGQLTFKVTDADDKAVSGTNVKVEKSTVGASTASTADDDPNTVAGLVTIGDKAAPGTYNIEVALSGVADSAASTSVTVAGKSANVGVEASSATSETIGDIITVTASLTDEDGNAVSDGTGVDFSVSPNPNSGLAAIGSNHSDTSVVGADSNGPKTKDGSASVRYAVVGAGTAVISATGVDSGATGVVVVQSIASTASVAPEAVSLDCLSNLSGFSVYSCGADSSASELFGLVSGRGATAIHLWNTSVWVRYSVIDGAMVPGSSDFTVTDDDILYISN